MSDSDAPRLFEYRDGRSDKFWEIRLEGSRHIVRYGRVGTDGQERSKAFNSAADARASAEKLIKAKTKKGYTEVQAAESRTHTIAAAKKVADEEAPFIQQILDAPEDLSRYYVFADWLQERGDPRGEFMSIQLRLEDENVDAATRQALTVREAELLQAHTRQWLGDLARFALDDEIGKSLDWRSAKCKYTFARGLLDSLTVEYLAPTVARALKESPHVRTLRRLDIEFLPNGDELIDEFEEFEDKDWDYDDSPGVDALIGARFDNLRVLNAGDESYSRGSNLERVLETTPRLESFSAAARYTDTASIFVQDLPELRSLSIDHQHEYPLERLAANTSLTKLRQISFFPHMLEPGDDGPYITTEGFVALCNSPHLKSLDDITLYCTELGDDGIEALIESGTLGRLKVLNLTYGTVTDAGARRLAAAGVDHLQRLTLTGNYMTPIGVELLERTGVNLHAGEQYNASSMEDQEHLWHGDME